MDPTSIRVLLGSSNNNRHWILTLDASNDTDRGWGIRTDSLGNIYVVGQSIFGSGNVDIVLFKFDRTGRIQWQKKLGVVGSDIGTGLSIDSSGNVYIQGRSSGVDISQIILAKYNNSGILQWQREFGSSISDFPGLGKSVAVDSSGNVYITGQVNQEFSTTYGGALLAKYDSFGNLLWQRMLGGGSTPELSAFGSAVGLDNIGNPYIVGQFDSTGGKGFVAKYNSSGTLQWQRQLSSSIFTSIVIKESNIYVSGFGLDSYNTAVVVKYNTSGNIQWQRQISSSSADLRWNDLVLDSLENIYLSGTDKVSGRWSDANPSGNLLLAKYNNLGSIQWQRKFNGTLESGDLGNIAWGDASDIVVSASSRVGGITEDIFIAKLPDDGSKTGTWGPFTYSTTIHTESASTKTDSDGSLISSTIFLSSNTSTLTDTNGTMVATRTQVC